MREIDRATGSESYLTREPSWPKVRPGPDNLWGPGPQPTPPEAGIDFEHANVARMYDYFLGGSHNFAIDRELADRIIDGNSRVRDLARENRRFLMRAVRYCLDQGVRQFLDLGSGIPTADHVHGVARAVAPETRVAYVDFEPVAIAYSDELLAGVDGVTITRADIRDPTAVLTASTVTSVLDFTQPIGLLAVATLHCIPDSEDIDAIMATYRDALAPGSFVVVSHTSTDYDDTEIAQRMSDTIRVSQQSATPTSGRSRARIRELLGGRLIDPGLVDVARWRSDHAETPELGGYCGVAAID